jgi:S-formylglutathione hydrolase FrmB
LLVTTLLAQGGEGRRGRGNRQPATLTQFTYEVREFDSPSLKKKTSYGLFLPLGYADEKNKDKRYPVVVYLHGLHENHTVFQGKGESGPLDKARADGTVPELIFVTPNGGNSFYLNGKESGAYEDLIVKDLLPELEKGFRIAKERDQRVLMGNSMGGGGALRIALKHPELFGTVATHSAALFPVDPEEIDERFRRILYAEGGQGFGLSKIFGVPPDLEMWKKENPLWLADTIDVDKLAGLKIYFDCGGRDRYGFQKPNVQLHDLLEKRKIKHTWRLDPEGSHGTDYAIANLPSSLRFVGAALGINAAKAGLEGLMDGTSGKEAKPPAPASRKSAEK